ELREANRIDSTSGHSYPQSPPCLAGQSGTTRAQSGPPGCVLLCRDTPRKRLSWNHGTHANPATGRAEHLGGCHSPRQRGEAPRHGRGSRPARSVPPRNRAIQRAGRAAKTAVRETTAKCVSRLKKPFAGLWQPSALLLWGAFLSCTFPLGGQRL